MVWTCTCVKYSVLFWVFGLKNIDATSNKQASKQGNESKVKENARLENDWVFGLTKVHNDDPV